MRSAMHVSFGDTLKNAWRREDTKCLLLNEGCTISLTQEHPMESNNVYFLLYSLQTTLPGILKHQNFYFTSNRKYSSPYSLRAEQNHLELIMQRPISNSGECNSQRIFLILLFLSLVHLPLRNQSDLFKNKSNQVISYVKYTNYFTLQLV
jgi:hypothetical protein